MSPPAPDFEFGTDGPSLIVVGVDGSRASLRLVEFRHTNDLIAAMGAGRADPITAAFVQAICHHTMATPAHILGRLEPGR